MKKQVSRQAVIMLMILTLPGVTVSGCLQAKDGHFKPQTKVEAQVAEVDPVQWYETVQWQSADAVKALLESGADPDQLFFNGETALHLAVEQKNQELVTLLLAYGADVNIQQRKEGFTPLMYAAIMDDRPMIQLLASHGADPTAPDVDGYTTYHYLAARDNQAASRLLAGTAPVPQELPTRDGLTVADIAAMSKKSVRVNLAYAEAR